MIRMIQYFNHAPPLSFLYFVFSHLSIFFRNFPHPKYFLLLGVVFCSFSAWANAPIKANTGAYIGARLGYSYNQNSCVEIAIECDREDAGYGIFAGYNFNNYFAYELSGTHLGDTYAVYPNINLQGELNTIDISVKYTHSLYENIQVFGKLGFSYWEGEITGWENKLKDSGERPAAGAGVELPFSEHVTARLEFQYFDQLGNDWMGYTEAHFFSVSLVWNFSATKQYAFSPQKIIPHDTFATVRPLSIIVPEDVISQHVERALSDVIARY